MSEVPWWFSLGHWHTGQWLGHVLGRYLKNQRKPGAPAFTCQGFCWHNHGWPEAAWRCRRAWHLDEQVPLSFVGLHPGVVVRSQKPPRADSLLHVLKQIRNRKQGKGWLEPVTQKAKRRRDRPSPSDQKWLQAGCLEPTVWSCRLHNHLRWLCKINLSLCQPSASQLRYWEQASPYSVSFRY